MIDKLELKHIAPYLQHNLRYVAKKESDILNDTWADESLDSSTTFDQALSANNKQAIELLNSPITVELYLAHEGKDLHLGSGTNSLGYPIDDIFASEVKPLLRPMSDLFKPVGNGIGGVFSVANLICDKNVFYKIDNHRGENFIWNHAIDEEIDFTTEPQDLPHWITEILNEYHFDWRYDLIAKGLAEPIINKENKTELG